MKTTIKLIVSFLFLLVCSYVVARRFPVAGQDSIRQPLFKPYGTDLGPFWWEDQTVMNDRDCDPEAPSDPYITYFQIRPEETREATIKKLALAGIKHLRITIPWVFIEKTSGVYDWQETDDILRYANENGIEVLGMLFMTPEWASSGYHSKYPELDYPYDKGVIWAPPTDIADWQNWVDKTVRRYGCQEGLCYVKNWEVWNEEDNRHWLLIDGTAEHEWQERLAAFKLLLNSAADVIHSIDGPETMVAPGGFTGIAPQEENEERLFVEALLSDNQLMNKMDFFTFHAYQHWDNIDNLKRDLAYFKNLLQEKNLSDKQLWITELNFGMTNGFCYESDSPEAEADAERAAAFFDDAYQYAESQGVKRIFWFQYANNGSGPGFLEWDWQTRSGTYALNEPFYSRYQSYAANDPALPPRDNWAIDICPTLQGAQLRAINGQEYFTGFAQVRNNNLHWDGEFLTAALSDFWGSEIQAPPVDAIDTFTVYQTGRPDRFMWIVVKDGERWFKFGNVLPEDEAIGRVTWDKFWTQATLAAWYGETTNHPPTDSIDSLTIFKLDDDHYQTIITQEQTQWTRKSSGVNHTTGAVSWENSWIEESLDNVFVPDYQLKSRTIVNIGNGLLQEMLFVGTGDAYELFVRTNSFNPDSYQINWNQNQGNWNEYWLMVQPQPIELNFKNILVDYGLVDSQLDLYPDGLINLMDFIKSFFGN